MVVNSGSPNKEMAWQFLAFLLSDEPYLRYVRAVKAQPILKSVAALPEFNSDPMLQTYASQAVYLPPKFAHDKNSLEVIGTYVERFAYGHMDAATAVQRMQAEINTQIQLGYERQQREAMR